MPSSRRFVLNGKVFRRQRPAVSDKVRAGRRTGSVYMLVSEDGEKAALKHWPFPTRGARELAKDEMTSEVLKRTVMDGEQEVKTPMYGHIMYTGAVLSALNGIGLAPTVLGVRPDHRYIAVEWLEPGFELHQVLGRLSKSSDRKGLESAIRRVAKAVGRADSVGLVDPDMLGRYGPQNILENINLPKGARIAKFQDCHAADLLPNKPKRRMKESTKAAVAGAIPRKLMPAGSVERIFNREYEKAFASGARLRRRVTRSMYMYPGMMLPWSVLVR